MVNFGSECGRDGSGVMGAGWQVGIVKCDIVWAGIGFLGRQQGVSEVVIAMDAIDLCVLDW